jgi:hypothetical protein
MKLAVFTPGAYIWPVHRSFEAFIASLACPASGTASLADSKVYPAFRSDLAVRAGLPEALDSRLVRLHRELYDALLRPVEHFEKTSAGIADTFWPDLKNIPAGELFNAFLFYFLRRDIDDIPVVSGLAVLRAVFFNHEAAEPEHWLHSAQQRLRSERCEWPCGQISLQAPTSAQLSKMSFVIHSDRFRPAHSPGWITGLVERTTAGRCMINASYGLDPSLLYSEQPRSTTEAIEQEVLSSIRYVFGWQQEDAA